MEHERSRGDRYALAALKNKRATIASEIIQLERQLRHRKDMLVHVDATLKLLDPSIEVDAIPHKRPPQRIKLFRQGELGRMIIDAIRRNGGEASLQHIVDATLDAGDQDVSARRALSPRVRGNLAYLNRQGKIVKTGDGRGAIWSLSTSRGAGAEATPRARDAGPESSHGCGRAWLPLTQQFTPGALVAQSDRAGLC